MIEAKLIYSPLQTKKYRMEFYKDGKYWKKTDFGQKGASDFTIHGDVERKNRYLARHAANENWNDLFSAGALSRYLLWNKKSLDASLKDYLKMLK